MDLLKIPYEHPFSIEWKLKKSEMVALNRGIIKCTEDYFASKIAGVRYYFSILPNGNYNDPIAIGKTTWIYMCLSTGNANTVKATFQVSVESANVNQRAEHVFEKPETTKILLCKSHEFFDPANNYFTNDETIITINGTLKFNRPLISKVSYSISTKWTIKFSDLNRRKRKSNSGCYLESETFNIPSNPDIKYSLQIRYNTENHGKVLNFQLKNIPKLINCYKEIETISNFSINSTGFSKQYWGILEKSRAACRSPPVPYDLFDVTKGYIVDGEINITAEGHLFAEKNESEFKLLDNDTVSLTSKFQEKNFKIIVGENEIYVNKELLADVSTVWNGMLQSGMKETIENKIEITDFPFNVVDAAIKLIYGISPLFKRHNMLPLLVFSDKYGVKFIKDLVENYLISELAPSNVCQLIHFSNLFNATKLFKKSAEFFVKCSHDKTSVHDFDLIDEKMSYKIFCSTRAHLPY